MSRALLPLFALVALFACSTGTHGSRAELSQQKAPLTLGADHELSPRIYDVPSGGSQFYAMTWTGSGWITVWATRGRIDGARLGTTGSVLDAPAKTLVAPDPAVRNVAADFDGSSLLIAWGAGDVIKARRFAADLTPLGSAFTVSSTALPLGVSDKLTISHAGGRFLVVWSQQAGIGESHRDLLGAFVKADGSPDGAQFAIATEQLAEDDAHLATDGTDFVVAYATNGTATGCATRKITSATKAVGARLAVRDTSYVPTVRIAHAGAPGNYVVLCSGGATPDALQRVGNDNTLGGAAVVIGGGSRELASNGTGFSLVTATSDVGVQRLAVDGTLLDAQPQLLGLTLTSSPYLAVAPTGPSTFAGYLDAADSTNTYPLRGVRIDPSARTTLDLPGTPLSLATPSQKDVRLASDGSGGALALWSEQGRVRGARLAADATPVGKTLDFGVASSAHIAFAANVYGVLTYDGQWRFTRVQTDGTVLDVPGKVIAGSVRAFAAEGTTFGVVVAESVNGSSQASLVRFGADGQPIGAATVLAADHNRAALAAGGGRFAVVLEQYAKLTAVRVNSNGTREDATAVVVSDNGRTPSIAYGGNTFYVGYHLGEQDNGDIVVRRLPSTGAIDATPIPVAVRGGPQRLPALASDGTSALVVWSEEFEDADANGDGSLVYSDGTLAQPDGFSFAPRTLTAYSALGAAPLGANRYVVAWVEYDRARRDASTGTRVFARTLSFAKKLAASCGTANDCERGFCVDGVCCDRACDGQCEACDVPTKEGTCSPVTGAPRPKKRSCPGFGEACGYACDGLEGRTCTAAVEGKTCGTAACASGVESHASTCDGIGRCNDVPKKCGAYACDTTSCRTNCTADGHCSAGFFCKDAACVPVESLGKACTATAECSTGATCVDGVCCGEASCGGGRSCATPAKKGTCAKLDGQSCAADAECGSSHCIDGVCCDTACGAQCAACDVTGSIGKCVTVIGRPHGARTACTSDVTNACAARRCNGADASACSGYVGKEVACRVTSCAMATVTEAARCDGLGACPAATSVPCGAFACDEASAACRTSCTIDAQCATGYACQDGTCVGRAAKCSDDGLKLVAADGSVSVCTPARCSAGKCLDACTSSDDCAPGFACSESRCVTAAAPGGDDGGGCSVAPTASGGSSAFPLCVLGLVLARVVRRRRAPGRARRRVGLLALTALSMACAREPSRVVEISAPTTAMASTWRAPFLSPAVAVPLPTRRFVEREGIADNGLVRIDGARMTVSAVSFAVERLGREGVTIASSAPPRIEGDRVVLARGDVREEITSLESGAEQSFVFARKPRGNGDLVLRTRVTGAASVDLVPGGAIVHGSEGDVRYDGTVFVDAEGTRTALTPRWEGGALVLAVPAHVVEAARYPAVLDPTLGVITDVSPAVRAVPWLEGNDTLTMFGTTPVVGFEAYGTRLARIAADGTAIDKPARLLARDAGAPGVAWNGTVGLVATPDNGGLRIMRVGADGARLAGGDLVLPLSAPKVSAIASGNTFFVAAPTYTNELVVIRVSSEGAHLGTTTISSVPAYWYGGAPALAAHAGGIDVLWSTFPSLAIASAQVDAAGTITKAAAVVEGTGNRRFLTLARNGAQAMLVFREGGMPRALPLSDALAAAGPAVDLSSAALDNAPGVFAEGTGYYAAWAEGAAGAVKLRGTKVSGAGGVATAGGAVLTDLSYGSDVSMVRTASYGLAVARGRTVRFDPATSTLVGQPTQAAFIGDEHYSRAVVFDGKTYVVAFGGTHSNIAFDGMYTARFDAAGVALDATPLDTGVKTRRPELVGGGGVAFVQEGFAMTRVLDGRKTGVTYLPGNTGTALGWNGTSFAAAGDFDVLRVAADGTRIDATTRHVPAAGYIASVSGMVSGEGRVLLLLRSYSGEVLAIRYKDDGTFEDSKLLTIGSGSFAWGGFARGKFLVVRRSGDDELLGAFVDATGKVSAPIAIELTKGNTNAAVGSDGSRFLVAYFLKDSVTKKLTLRAMQVEIDGTVSPSFVIDTEVADHASIASAAPGKFLVAYGKINPTTLVPHAMVRAVTLGGSIGATCAVDGDCEGGSCVDGYCCDSKCGARCAACDVAGQLGHCTAVTGAPHGTRTQCGEPSGTCGLRCDGIDTAKCRPVDQGTPCSKTECTAGASGSVETHASSCDGLGACNDVPKACGAYACDALVCRTTCTTKTDCALGNWCKGSGCVPVEGLGRVCADTTECSAGATCVDAVCCEASSCGTGSTCAGTAKPGFCAKKDGETCAATADCASGFCVDGVCCGTACTSQCQACDVAGSLGKCVAVTGKPHGSRAACASDTTNLCAEARCDGNDTTKCAALVGNDVTCRPAACAGGSLTREARCDGAGACPVLSTASCAGFGCSADGKNCRSSCASDTECSEGFMCESTACVPQADRCSTDGTSVRKIDGSETSCTPTRCRAGKCIAVCLSSVDCADGYNCDANGACIAPPSLPSEEEGGGCTTSRRSSSSFALFLAGLVALMSARRRTFVTARGAARA